MYKKMLVALENTGCDQALLEQIPELAKLLHSELLLLHVADGWAARNFNQLRLAASKEMQEDWDYLEHAAERLRKHHLTVNTILALGNPPSQILRVAEEEKCDLIVLASHGHRLIADIIYGSTIDAVRHAARVPVLAIPAKI